VSTVAVIDYGMGNLRSVCKAIEHVAPAARVRLASSEAEVRRADRVIFPGQGAIVACMRALQTTGMGTALLDALRNKPFLGLCLGLQALYESSEEGDGTPCLGVLPGRVRRFEPAANGADNTMKVPHMGWNRVHQTRAHPLWRGIPDDARFYFVHSYYADTAEDGTAVGTTDYGVRFTSAAARENIFAVQFHPEKSQQAGLKLLANFVEWS
jgi:imidazole glycerol-phosphate synthase subunit HisH